MRSYFTSVRVWFVNVDFFIQAPKSYAFRPETEARDSYKTELKACPQIFQIRNPNSRLFPYFCTMSFTQRLGKYFIGMSIGVLISFALFSNRGCGKWLPGTRVKSQINEKAFSYSASADCLMQCLSLSEDDVQQMIDKGDVRFSESETHEKPLNYVIESHITDGLKVQIELRDTVSFIKTFMAPKSADCGC